MLEYLKKLHQEGEDKLKDLYKGRGLAGPEAIGPIQNAIDTQKRELLRLSNEIGEEEAKYQTPNQVKIFFYILVSTKEEVAKNTGEVFPLFDEDRYHDTECCQWKPFSSKETIEALIKPIEESYPVKATYLNGNIADEVWIALDEEINNSVAIIDLFSINEQNKLMAVRFDKDEAGVIMPLCSDLHKDLCEAANKFRECFKVLKAKSNIGIPCNLYEFGVARKDSFTFLLGRVFKQKFPIKNQAIGNSQLRGISI